jgi:hypothetical protein
VLSEAAGEVSSDDRPTTLTHSHSCGSGAVILPPGRRVKVTFGERQVVAAAVPVCVGGCGCGCHLPTPKFHSHTNHIALLVIDIGAERSTTSEATVTSYCDTSLVLQSTRWINFDWIRTAEQVCQDKKRATIARPKVPTPKC